MKERETRAREKVEQLREEWYFRVENRRNSWMEKVAKLNLPGNPLDMIISDLGGPTQVAESK